MGKLIVLENEINIKKVEDNDYLCITDMVKSKDGDFFVTDWLRNRNTLEFLGVWESLNNPNFNYGEFAIIKSKAGLNNFKISIKEWVLRTNAIGLQAVAGRYGGSYAHIDIAYEFAMWISPKFKVYLIKEFQRLKEKEKQNLSWNIKRQLSKTNYLIHTDAIKNNLLPDKLTNEQINKTYASEADVLNMALFGKTASEWRKENPNLSGNIRDYANINELICLSNLESINAVMINDKIKQNQRLVKLNEIAISQLKILEKIESKLIQ